jgi:hypothetical protein
MASLGVGFRCLIAVAVALVGVGTASPPSSASDRSPRSAAAGGSLGAATCLAAAVGPVDAGSAAATATTAAWTAAATTDLGPVTIRVFVHVIRTVAGGGVDRSRIEAQIRLLSRAYAGRQSALSAVTPYRFVLAGVDVSVNANWYRMTQGSRPERVAKTRLHRGDARDLNIYTVAGESGVLGWTTGPVEYATAPRMDGVVLARHTLPGGYEGPYSQGDAAVHEVGHWLGLLHTFAGGCSPFGDGVADTPAERLPSYKCQAHRDTCEAPGFDPVHNFMDYSYDACMNQFTRGQVQRMNRFWRLFRADGGG